ncbi:hypothetical protein ACFLXT_02075 [Chloroflexota bacterium]
MKLGIALLVIGVALLILAIPYSILLGIVSGVTQLEEGNISGGVSAYYGIIGVIVGFVMTAIGAIKVFKQ